MPVKLSALSVTATFFAGRRARVAGVVCLQVLSAFAENLGILALLPIIQSLVAPSGQGGVMGKILSEIVTTLGLPVDLRSYLLLVAMTIILRAAIAYTTLRAGNTLVLDIVTAARFSLASALINLRWPAFARQKTGEVVSLQIAEIERFRPGLSAFLTLMTATVQIVLYLGSSILISWQLTLLAFAFGGVKMLALKPIRSSAFRLGGSFSAGINELSVSFVEGLNNIKPVRAMGLDSSFLSRLKRGIENYRLAIDAMMRNAALFTIADDLLTSGVLVAVLFVCTTVLTVDLAQVAVVGLLMSRVLVQVGMLQKAQHTIDSTASVANRIVDTLADYRRNAEFSFGGRKVSLQHSLRFENVSLGYDDKSVLRGVDLTIPAGTLCAIVGMSGGGKTTLVDGVLGLLSPTAGRILIDGVDLTKADILAWRSRVGYVPQELVLFNDTVMANIVLSRPDVDEAQVRKALAAAEALKFVDALPQGLHTPIGERGTTLSGGQRQRLALARALVHDPDLLILDEATTALDPVTEAEICETLRHIAGKRTIIAVSHQPRVAQVADMIVQVSESGVSAAPTRSLAEL